MDILAHFLWTFGIYWQHPKRWIAGVIGFMPDIVSFGPHFMLSIARGVELGKPHDIPSYIYAVYSISHSLVICAIGLFLLWHFAKNWFWLSFGWPLHILIDIPTHTDAFFPTPIFWPISGFEVSGISWATGWFMAMNYGLLAVLYAWLVLKVPRINGYHT